MSKLTQVLHLMPTITDAVQTVEAISQSALDTSLTGAQKLASSTAIVQAGLAGATDPAIKTVADDFANYAPTIQSIINALVMVYNMVGLFKKKA